MTHWVYVIELDPEVVRSSAFRTQNPHWETADRCFYVGETAREPAVRFEQHKTGGRLSSSIVRRWGRYLRTRMCRRCADRSEGRRLERETAERLRRKGHAAYFN